MSTRLGSEKFGQFCCELYGEVPSDVSGGGGSEGAFSLEKSLQRISEIVRSLEQSDVALEDSLKLFEEGVQLTRQCHGKLTEVEKRIEILTKVGPSGVETKPYGGKDST